MRLEHRGAYVDVDVGLVPDEAFELGRLYQVIGEMHKPPMQVSGMCCETKACNELSN